MSTPVERQRSVAPRQPEHTVLHRVVRDYFETFLAETRQRGEGERLPLFVEREFREFLAARCWIPTWCESE